MGPPVQKLELVLRQEAYFCPLKKWQCAHLVANDSSDAPELKRSLKPVPRVRPRSSIGTPRVLAVPIRSLLVTAVTLISAVTTLPRRFDRCTVYCSQRKNV